MAEETGRRYAETKEGEQGEEISKAVPLSLYPLNPETALRIAVNTPLPEKYRKKKRSKRVSK